jgi:hypothetical protein
LAIVVCLLEPNAALPLCWCVQNSLNTPPDCAGLRPGYQPPGATIDHPVLQTAGEQQSSPVLDCGQ